MLAFQVEKVSSSNRYSFGSPPILIRREYSHEDDSDVSSINVLMREKLTN